MHDHARNLATTSSISMQFPCFRTGFRTANYIIFADVNSRWLHESRRAPINLYFVPYTNSLLDCVRQDATIVMIRHWHLNLHGSSLIAKSKIHWQSVTGRACDESSGHIVERQNLPTCSVGWKMFEVQRKFVEKVKWNETASILVFFFKKFPEFLIAPWGWGCDYRFGRPPMVLALWQKLRPSYSASLDATGVQ